MTVTELVGLLAQCPLVASAQASPNSPTEHPDTLARLALASVREGVRLLRMQGRENISAGRRLTRTPCIGLIKRDYPDSDIYITATSAEVREVLSAGAEIVALDGTPRARPHGELLRDLVVAAHEAGALVLADVDSLESAKYATEAGVDLVSTTLAGYTPSRAATKGPDLVLLREIVRDVAVPVLAEGRFAEPWQVNAALQIGAAGVVVGGALNDPEKTTRRMLPPKAPSGNVGAVDIGGTWLRFGAFSPDWNLTEVARTPNPPKRQDRLAWIREQVARFGAVAVGIGTGGIVDPATGLCWTAKEYLMPDQIGILFDEAATGVATVAHGDGHATAWGHACLPQFAGTRVATLALGTGVGCGFVQDGRIWAGPRGEYPRVNDLPTPSGDTVEGLLGGINLTSQPDEEQKRAAVEAFECALSAVRNLYFPDHVVVGGSVGLSDWMRPHLERLGCEPTPFGSDAGLYGAAALAIFPGFQGE